MPPFAELIAATNFSFLRGASHAHEMVGQAAELGLAAIGIADRNTLAGVVRAYAAAKEHKIRLIVGARLVTRDDSSGGFEAVCYPADRDAYGRLCRLLTDGNRRAVKGQCHFSFEEMLAASEGQILIAIPPRDLSAAFIEHLSTLAAAARDRVYLAAVFAYRGDERRRLGALSELAAQARAPLVATTDALYHHPIRRPLADMLVCIREKCTIAEAGYRLEANAERHLKSGAEMARLLADYPQAVARTLDIPARVRFSLDDLRYEYPEEPVPVGKTPQAHLEDLTWAHAEARFADGIPDKVRSVLEKELALIARLDYARYFLTVYDIVRFAREEARPPILCQGRGSAANSAVCYCLGITSVDPTRIDLLFERFISADRGEPPDIDVDFEHERREEVIQYLYNRYGRDRAAICSTVIHYRSRMAIREVGKALGLKEDVTAALAGLVWGIGDDDFPEERVREAGLDPANPSIRRAVGLARQLIGFPRHLSQHVGGFVLTRERLDETVPIHNGAMPDRTFLEWDKDDIDALGMLKVDVLALGMLTAIRKSFDLIERHYGDTFTLATVPPEDDGVYEMLSRANSVGVFQVEIQGADVDAAAPQAAQLLRPRHRGGDRAPRPDPGRHGAPLPAPPQRTGARQLSLRGLGEGAAQDAGRAAVPGAGDADRHRGSGLLARGGRQAAPRHGHLPPHRHHPSVPREVHRRHGGEQLRARVRRALLRPDRGLWRVRLPREPRGELRAAGLRLLLDQALLSRGVLRRPPQQPAHGLLRPRAAGARRPRARRYGAPPRCELQRVGLYAGAGASLSPLAGRGWGERSHSSTLR